jgi:RimJ/RimL family protein N-acetyltransferase
MAEPFLLTERFELWQPQIGDLGGMIELIADEETRRYLGPMPVEPKGQFERLLRDAGGWSLYGYSTFLVRLKGEPAIIAKCGVFRSWRDLPGLNDVPEAGWIVRRDWWGKGLAGEAMRAVLAWFDEAHGRQRIGCMIEDGNVASERLAARLGFVEYGREEGEGGDRALVFYERQ